MAPLAMIQTNTSNKRLNNSNKRSLESFATKLSEKIINASSAAAIDRYVAVAVKTLGNNKVNGYIILRFIDRVSAYLNNHAATDPQQAANIVLAAQRLQQFRQKISAPAGR